MIKKIEYILYTLLLSLFVNEKILANVYYVSSNENGDIKIVDENNISSFETLNKLFNFISSGDKVLFKRGDKFKTDIKIENKSGIYLGAYGNTNRSLPVIYLKDNIAINKRDIEIAYPRDFGEEFGDNSWKNLSNYFENIYNSLAYFTGLKSKIAKSFQDVKNKVYEIARFKFPYYKYRYFDPNAIRLWMGNREILKALCFEELNCTDCKYKVRWFYEQQNNYLYLFSMDPNLELRDIVDFLYFNNPDYATLKLINSKKIDIKNLDIRDGKYSIVIRGGEDINITSSIVGKGAFTGIYVTNDMDDFKKGSKNILIDKCLIDGDFKFDYRFSSLRNSQDGIFFLNNVQDSTVSNSRFYHWGHTGINLSVSDRNQLNLSEQEIREYFGVKRNRIIKNTFDGKDMPYMRAISFDNRGCENNIFSQNVIKNMRVRSQINGSENIISYNIVYNVQNSQIKMDQGYGSGQGFQFEAYGSLNISSKNVVSKNLIIKTDEAAISISSRSGYGNIEDNNITDNIIIDCGNNVFQNPKKDYNKTSFDIIDIDNDYSTIKANNFIANKVYTPYETSFVFYRGEILDIENFNKYPKEGDAIKNNLLFTFIDTSKVDEFDYDSKNFVLDDKYLFIYRLYLNTLKRFPGQNGLFYWYGRLKSIDSNENKKDSALDISKFFFFSKEMQEANLSNEEYVERLYNTLLNRKSDEGGKKYWIEIIEKNHIKKEVIFYQFIVSKEFKDLAKSYNIEVYTPKGLLESFVERLYLLILERMFDGSGRAYWTNELLSGKKSASDIVKNFFHSKEFLDKNITNKRFVYLSYMAILNRQPDKNGWDFWVSKLENNATRDDIINGFLSSKEFEKLASEYSIKNIK